MYWAYWALVEKREGIQEVARGPPCPSLNCTREGGGGPPLLPSLHLLLPPSPTPTRKGGVLLPVGVGLPPWRSLLLGWPPPPLLLYIRGQGAPLDTQVDLLIYSSRVRCPLMGNVAENKNFPTRFTKII